MTNQENKNNSRGFALFLLLAAMVFVAGIVVGVVFLLSQRLRQSTYHNIEARALYLAEAGFNDAWWELTASLEVNGNATTSRVGEIDSLQADYGSHAFSDGPTGKCWAADPHVPMAFDAWGIATTAETSYARCQDVRKMVSQGLRIGPFRYAVFVGGQGTGDFNIRTIIGSVVLPDTIWGRGDVFINDDVDINATNKVYGTVYLPRDAAISNLGFAKITRLSYNPGVVMPDIDTSFYHYYIRQAATLPAGNVTIAAGTVLDLNTYSDCVYLVNGNLTVRQNVTITNNNLNPNIIGIIAVTGWIRFTPNATGLTSIDDNIHIIANGNITMNNNDIDVTIGSPGRSGNILYSKNGTIQIGAGGTHTINGSILSNTNNAGINGVQTNETINGILYARLRARLQAGTIRGSVVINFTSNNYTAATIFEPSYLPYPLSGNYLRGGVSFPFTETQFGLPESLFTVRKIPHTWSYK